MRLTVKLSAHKAARLMGFVACKVGTIVVWLWEKFLKISAEDETPIKAKS